MKLIIKVFRIFLIFSICLFSGCAPQKTPKKYSYEWDGQFLYKYHPEDSECTIVGMTPTYGEIGKAPEKLCFPSHYKGKIVVLKSGVSIPINEDAWWGVKPIGVNIETVKELYLSYLGTGSCGYNGGTKYEIVYVPQVGYEILELLSPFVPQVTIFVPEYGFEDIYTEAKNDGKKIEINNSYCYFIYYQNKNEIYKIIYKANTAYMFNYEGAPNENYYFINNFERGGLIENTPYEPYREGYTFLGWYKDSDCTEIWDFETDTLPVATYDENGELEFVETRLYAKWSKT